MTASICIVRISLIARQTVACASSVSFTTFGVISTWRRMAWRCVWLARYYSCLILLSMKNKISYSYRIFPRMDNVNLEGAKICFWIFRKKKKDSKWTKYVQTGNFRNLLKLHAIFASFFSFYKWLRYKWPNCWITNFKFSNFEYTVHIFTEQIFFGVCGECDFVFDTYYLQKYSKFIFN